MNGCLTFLPPRIIAENPSLSASGADNDSSPRHHIFICGIGGCFFCSLSGAIRFAAAKRKRQLCCRISRGCATTNAIVLMTLPTALQGAVSTAASGYIISTHFAEMLRSSEGQAFPLHPLKTKQQNIYPSPYTINK